MAVLLVVNSAEYSAVDEVDADGFEEGRLNGCCVG